jgi:hypothetical protein
MSTKKRDVIFGGRVIGANIRAQHARDDRGQDVADRHTLLSFSSLRICRSR